MRSRRHRHDRFIDLAQQAGDIDFVFFGTTNTEMWHWKERGLTTFGIAGSAPLKAANFGSQGTRPSSFVWRMQHGELAGYRAKLVVLRALTPGPASPPDVALRRRPRPFS